MSRFGSSRHSRRAGLPPGTLIQIGSPPSEPLRVSCFRFDQDDLEELHPSGAEDCPGPDSLHDRSVLWINVDGVHDAELIERIGRKWGIHPLVLEDVMTTDQRPKIEEYDEYLFVVVKMLRLDDDGDVLPEQVSMVLGPGYLLTFQEAPGDVFETIRERLRTSKGRIRKMGSDYLAYALLDAISDNYFVVFERFSESVEAMHEAVFQDPTPNILQRIYRLKRHGVFLRKATWPLRDLVSSLGRVEVEYLSRDTRLYLRDLHDHATQLVDILEVFRESVSGLMDVYLSSASNRMNEVMKVLTIIATIFIPLTFIAGVYGMNFQHMPELHWPWAYPAVLGIMLAVALGMFAYFRKKRWL